MGKGKKKSVFVFDFNNLGSILNVIIETKGRFSLYHPKCCKLKVK